MYVLCNYYASIKAQREFPIYYVIFSFIIISPMVGRLRGVYTLDG